MTEYSYEDFMVFTGRTDQFLGRQYRCPKCGKEYWSAWGWARRHFEKETGQTDTDRPHTDFKAYKKGSGEGDLKA